MSAATAVGAGEIRGRHPCGLHRFVRGFVLGTVALNLAIIAYGAISSSNAFRDACWGLVAWEAIVSAVAQLTLTKGPESKRGFLRQSSTRKAGPRRDPPWNSRLSRY